MAKVRVAVLASGSGTNLQALLDASRTPAYPASVALVVSDQPQARALVRAREAGVATILRTRKEVRDREDWDAHLVRDLKEHDIEWVVLAGFMRLVSTVLLDGLPPWRVLNIHPALLPAFPGLHAPRQALKAGVRVSGATVHFVDSGCDTGPIIAQALCPVHPEDSEEDLSHRIQALEHRLYPMVLRMVVEDRVKVVGRQVFTTLMPEETLLLT